MEDGISQIYFEDILIFAETSNVLRSISEELTKEMHEYFLQYGWMLTVIPSKSGKLKFYFYGKNENLIKANLEIAKGFFKTITSNQEELAYVDEYFNKKKENIQILMNFETLSKYLDAFAVHFNKFFKDQLIRGCELRHKVDYDILKFDPYSVCLNGITLKINVPSSIEDSVELDITSILSAELEYISDFDPHIDKNDRISKKINNNTAQFIVILRFSPKDRYSLKLSKNVDTIPDQGLYRGINKIASDMFRYIRIHEYEKAQQRLTYEETKLSRDKRTIKKLRVLRKLLERYQHYQSLINILESTPDDKIVQISRLEKEIAEIINKLNKADFFKMCIISQRDFRVFELKISSLINQIEIHKVNAVSSRTDY